jgi:DUF218 domain
MGDAKARSGFGLLRRRECIVPTWRGWLVILVSFVVAGLALIYEIYPMLAVSRPITAKVLVVEGWVSESTLRAAINEYVRGGYERMFVTGGPLTQGIPLAEFKTLAQHRTLAELGAASLRALNFQGDLVAVPAAEAKTDRTYNSALALKRWLGERGSLPAGFNLLTSGPHARRSWMMFRAAFGKDAAIGVIAVPEEHYDPAHWWRTSLGFRTVVDETIAYLYARLVFHAPSSADGKPL